MTPEYQNGTAVGRCLKIHIKWIATDRGHNKRNPLYGEKTDTSMFFPNEKASE